MSTFLNHNKNSSRRPSSHLLSRKSSTSRGVVLNRRTLPAASTNAGRPSTAFAAGRPPAGRGNNEGVVNDGGGQVQLQRQQQPMRQQGQQQGGGKEVLKEGQIDMEEVLQDIAILEQQQLDSERQLQSVKLARQQKLELKSAQETKLSKLKYENGSMRADLQRANKELSLRHRQLIEAKSRADSSRKEQNRFDAKLRRALGVARLLPAYRKKIECAVIALNEAGHRLNFLKGQSANRLNAARSRRDDARHRHELLGKAILAGQQRVRAAAEDIVKIRAEIAGNEHDLSSAQQMESQTKLRVETIEHEMSMERSRHVEAVVLLETKSKEVEESKAKTLESIEEKRAMIEAKKEELGKIWAKCNELRKAEGHEVLPMPNWGVDHAQSLDVARIRVRVNAEQDDLRAKKNEREKLQADVGDLESLAESHQSEASKLRNDAEALTKATAEGRTVEEHRKEAVKKAVEEADADCKEVEGLHQSIKDLTATQEKNAADLRQLIDKKDENISDLQKDIESTLAELQSVDNNTKEAESNREAKKAQFEMEIAKAKETKDIIENAFKRAQERAEDFAVQPDDELVAEMKQLDDDEEAIINDADRERDEVISKEPFLENVKYDHGSSIPLNDQAKEGMALLNKYCLEFIQEAQAERQIRVDQAKDAHFARIEEEEEARRQEEEQERLRMIEKEEREERARLAAAERERKRVEARRRAEQDAEAEKLRLEQEAEEKRLEEVEMEKQREEEEAQKRREEREKKRKIEEERKAAKAAAELERKEREEKRREEEKRRRARAAEEKEKKAAAELERKEREQKRREEEKRRRAEAAEEKEKKVAAELERKERERERREEERKRRAEAAEEKEKKVAAELERKERERERREEERKRRAEAAEEEEKKVAAELERKERERERREEERKRRAEAAEEKEKKVAADLERKERERERREEERKRRAESELRRRAEEEAAKKRKEQDLKEMRAKSREVQEKFRVEGESKQSVGDDVSDAKLGKNRPSKKRSYEIDDDDDLWNTGADDFDFSKKLKDDASKREGANRQRKSDGSVKSSSRDALKSKSNTLKPDKTRDKRVRDASDEKSRKQSKTDTSRRDSTQTQKSLPSQSAIRTKDSKRPKSTSGVRFDSSATRPQLDIFSSNVHGKSKERTSKSSKPTSKLSSQTSGISSSEGAVRRRKKAPSKNKSSVLAITGFEDDAGFL